MEGHLMRVGKGLEKIMNLDLISVAYITTFRANFKKSYFIHFLSKLSHSCA